MTKTQQDFTYYTGEDKDLRYTITDENDASLLTTSMTAEWYLRDEPDSASLLRYATSGSGVSLSGCTITVSVAASDTAGCTLSGTYYTELAASDSAGKAAALAWGYATIHRRV